MQIILLTLLTMIAFAANSVFGRIALEDGAIDAASYSSIRLVSGALMLAILVIWQTQKNPDRYISGTKIFDGNWISAFALFTYAAAFSYAYLWLETGIGALILFSCVQATMIGWPLINGDRPLPLEWFGLITAFGAFIWLLLPGLSAPNPFAALLMAISGIAWGVYSLRGKTAADPLKATAGNFVRSVPIALVLLLAVISFGTTGSFHLSSFGIIMAIASGAITSALGYALWYRVLKNLSSTKAAIVQLTVPVIAGIGGTVFLGEAWSFRFALSSALILGGVAIAILAKAKRIEKTPTS